MLANTELTNKQMENLQLGYCCINMDLRELGIFTSRTCRLDTIKKRGIEYSYTLVRQNLRDLACIIRWNNRNNIRNYRMSSEMFPFATHPDYYREYNIDQFADELRNIGLLAKSYGQRLTFHPGQYNQLTSLRETVIEKAIVDIDFHARVLDMMGVGSEGVIVIHGGSKNGGVEAALERFSKSFVQLSESSQRRLVLENCEMSFSIEDLLPLCERLKIPLVIDYHHHNINPGTQNLQNTTERVLDIWKSRDIIPLFHVSESRCGVTEDDSITVRRAHSDYIRVLPEPLLQLGLTHRIDVDIEAKMKERAVFGIFERYNWRVYTPM